MAICDIIEEEEWIYVTVRDGYSPKFLVVYVESSVSRVVIISICDRVERTPDEVEWSRHPDSIVISHSIGCFSEWDQSPEVLKEERHIPALWVNFSAHRGSLY